MAGLVPQEILDEIMDRADIVEVVGEYVSLKRRGRNWFGLCPFHQEDTPSFSVNQERQFFKCFGCGEGGNVLNFIQKAEHLTYGEAARRLAERYNITIPERAMSQEEQARHSLRQALLAAHDAAAKFYQEQLPLSPAAQAYLSKRGVSREMAERFGLGAAPQEEWQALYQRLRERGYGDETLINGGLVSRSTKNGRCYDKFHGRLIFPIRDQRGAVVALGGRSITQDEPKYLNSQTTPIYNKSSLLYAFDVAADSIRRQGRAVIMEGYMDVLTAHQYGVTTAVACLGTAFTPEHARLLSRVAPEPPARLQVLLAFDGDAAGQKATLASLEKLQSCDFIQPRVLIFPERLDPDDFLRQYGAAGWEELVEKRSYPLLDYLLLRAVEGRDLSVAADKGAIVRELAPALLRTANTTERDSFINQLAHTLQVREDTIYADLRLSQKSGSARPAPREPGLRREQPERPGHKANRQLLLHALADRDLFYRAWQRLGPDMASAPRELELIELVRGLGEAYSFRPASLFNHIPEGNEGLQNFLLKLLQEDAAQFDVDDCIRTIHQRSLAERLSDLQRRINTAAANHENVDDLVLEKLRLTQELKESD